MSDTARLLSDILGGTAAQAMDRLFRCVEIAEEEIAAAKLGQPHKQSVIHDAFRHLQPSEVLLEHGSERLYRKHCQEIIRRVTCGEKLRPATTAEFVGALSTMSLMQSLNRSAELAYWNGLSKLFPEDTAHLRSQVGPVIADDFDRAQAKDLEQTLRRKLSSHREEPDHQQKQRRKRGVSL
jgi:hypothetical protein